MGLLMRLIDAAFDVTSKRLASSLSRGAPLHPLHQPVLKLAQRWRIDVADEANAIETTVNLLLRFTGFAACGMGLYYQNKLCRHWKKQHLLELEENLEEYKQVCLEYAKMKAKQELQSGVDSKSKSNIEP